MADSSRPKSALFEFDNILYTCQTASIPSIDAQCPSVPSCVMCLKQLYGNPRILLYQWYETWTVLCESFNFSVEKRNTAPIPVTILSQKGSSWPVVCPGESLGGWSSHTNFINCVKSTYFGTVLVPQSQPPNIFIKSCYHAETLLEGPDMTRLKKMPPSGFRNRVSMLACLWNVKEFAV